MEYLMSTRALLSKCVRNLYKERLTNYAHTSSLSVSLQRPLSHCKSVSTYNLIQMLRHTAYIVFLRHVSIRKLPNWLLTQHQQATQQSSV